MQFNNVRHLTHIDVQGIPGIPGKDGRPGEMGYPGAVGVCYSRSYSQAFQFRSLEKMADQVGRRLQLLSPLNTGKCLQVILVPQASPVSLLFSSIRTLIYLGIVGPWAPSRGFTFTKHSQTTEVPHCPPGSSQLWNGYSLLYVQASGSIKTVYRVVFRATVIRLAKIWVLQALASRSLAQCHLCSAI